MASHLKKQLRCSATRKVWIGKTLTILCPSVAKRLGISAAGRALLVVYTLRRLKHGQESVRIISARRASRKERKAYDANADRKSTRLNSSHLVISYAVFCLKKKKKKKNRVIIDMT